MTIDPLKNLSNKVNGIQIDNTPIRDHTPNHFKEFQYSNTVHTRNDYSIINNNTEKQLIKLIKSGESNQTITFFEDVFVPKIKKTQTLNLSSHKFNTQDIPLINKIINKAVNYGFKHLEIKFDEYTENLSALNIPNGIQELNISFSEAVTTLPQIPSSLVILNINSTKISYEYLFEAIANSNLLSVPRILLKNYNKNLDQQIEKIEEKNFNIVYKTLKQVEQAFDEKDNTKLMPLTLWHIKYCHNKLNFLDSTNYIVTLQKTLPPKIDYYAKEVVCSYVAYNTVVSWLKEYNINIINDILISIGKFCSSMEIELYPTINHLLDNINFNQFVLQEEDPTTDIVGQVLVQID